MNPFVLTLCLRWLIPVLAEKWDFDTTPLHDPAPTRPPPTPPRPPFRPPTCQRSGHSVRPPAAIIAMAARGADGPFLVDLLTRSGFAADADDLSDDDGNEPGYDSGSVFSTRTIDKSEISDVYGNRAGGHGNELPRGVRVPGADIGPQNAAHAARPPFADGNTGECADGPNNGPRALNRTSRRPKRSRGGTHRRGGRNDTSTAPAAQNRRTKLNLAESTISRRQTTGPLRRTAASWPTQ